MIGYRSAKAARKTLALLSAFFGIALLLIQVADQQLQGKVETARRLEQDLWAFFQQKSIRLYGLQQSVDMMEVLSPEAQQTDVAKQRLEQVQRTIARVESEPDTGEGRRELLARAMAAAKRQAEISKFRAWLTRFSVSLQTAVVLAAAAVASGFVVLGWIGALLGSSACIGAFATWLIAVLTL